MPGSQAMACHVLDAGSLDLGGLSSGRFRQVAHRYRARAGAARSASGARAALGAGLLLAELLGVHDDSALRVGCHGKPALASGRPQFSLAHAGHLVVLVQGPVEVGVDIEPLGVHTRLVLEGAVTRAVGDHADVASGRAVSELEDDELVRVWTRIEASVKLDGRGLDLDVRQSPGVLDVPLLTGDVGRHVVSVASRTDGDVALTCLQADPEGDMRPWAPRPVVWPGRTGGHHSGEW